MRGGFQAETAVLRQGSMSTERGKIMQENLSYEKLSKRAKTGTELYVYGRRCHRSGRTGSDRSC